MKRGVASKRKKLYIEIGILVVVVIIAILISISLEGINFNFPAQTEQSNQPGQTQESPAAQDTGLLCDVASVEIIDVSISGNTARMFVRNNGGSNNLQMLSAIIFDKSGNAIETTSALDQDFDRGKVKFLAFDDPKISCNTFSRAVLTTNCAQAKATFSQAPGGC